MPYNMQGVGFRDRDTSAAAAQQVDAKTMRGLVLAQFQRSARPLTADQVAGMLGAAVTSIRPRVTELSILGAIEDSGQRGKTAAGRSSIAWRIKGSTQ